VSPDGRFIAYDIPAAEARSPRDIFVLATDGSSDTAVVQNPANDVDPVWSPNGAELAFISDRTGRNSLWSIPIENGRATGPARSIREDVGLIGLLGTTKNGTLLYFQPTANRLNLFVTEMEAGRATAPPVPATERLITDNVGSTWSRDGEFLAYYALQNTQADGRNGATVHGVVIIRTAKTAQERTVPLPTRVTSRFGAGPKWFPDGHSVLVEAGDAEGPGFGFYRLSLDTANTELVAHLPREISSYDLSPDGRSIFYAIPDNAHHRVIRLDIESGQEMELRNVPAGLWQSGDEVVALAVSPDGSELAMTLIGGAVEVMPASGGQPRELFRPAEPEGNTGALRQGLTWSPDQRFLLFFGGDRALWKVPAGGGEAEKMAISMTGVKSPTVSPDGKHLVFSAVAQLNPSKVLALENILPAQTAKK
jgi:tricorn protease